MSHSGGEKIAPATRSTTTGEEGTVYRSGGEAITPATIFATSGVHWPEPSRPPAAPDVSADSDSDFSRGS